MEIHFEQEYPDELYHRGKTKDKKHRFQPNIISRYIRCVDYLAAVLCPEELYQYNSLRFEVLHGDKEGKFSIRVNDQYRIEFTLSKHEEQLMVTICTICELSNHYK